MKFVPLWVVVTALHFVVVVVAARARAKTNDAAAAARRRRKLQESRLATLRASLAAANGRRSGSNHGELIADLLDDWEPHGNETTGRSTHHRQVLSRLFEPPSHGRGGGGGRRRRRRQLQAPPPLDEMMFNFLSCNEAIKDATNCAEFPTTFDASSSRYVIPCGTCFQITTPQRVLSFPHGLDVQGKLLIRNAAPGPNPIVIQTPFLVVQGVLEVDNTATLQSPNHKVLDISFPAGFAQEFFVTPHAENQAACVFDSCPVGKLPLVVAGGQLRLFGWRDDACPTWTRVANAPLPPNGQTRRGRFYVTSIDVDASVQSCWGVGSSILVTSSTNDSKDSQVSAIASIETLDGDKVRLHLTEEIWRPITLAEDTEAAVEVALLHRNIRVWTENTSTEQLVDGAHFMVMFSPGITQHVEGVTFDSLGQQGVLGRYSMHLHLNRNSANSILRRNLILRSKQRCVVLHGTNGVLVQDNVAYDTFGHCFMTEDGGERDNVFEGNLGAVIKAARFTIPTTLGESDFAPAVFWMSSPTNTWRNNVAAGSQDSGYWLELGDFVRGISAADVPGVVPIHTPLGTFQGNRAHSNIGHGFRLYPSGVKPPVPVFFDHITTYRNKRDGVQTRNSYNMAFVSNSLFFDNTRAGISLEGSDSVRLENVQMYGYTSVFRQFMTDERLRQFHCDGPGLKSMTAIRNRVEIREKEDYWSPGLTLTNLQVQGFDDTICPGTTTFTFSTEFDAVKLPHFDHLVSLRGLSSSLPSTPIFDFCTAASLNVHDAFVADLDSSLWPSLSGQQADFTGASVLVSNDARMLRFLEGKECLTQEAQCFVYCKDACVRTVSFTVQVYDTQDVVVRVADAGNPGRFTDITGSFYDVNIPESGETTPPFIFRKTEMRNLRVFSATLPQGSYVASFKGSDRSTTVWPTFVEISYEPAPACTGHLQVGSVTVEQPPPTGEEGGVCSQLIRNGNAESRTYDYWYHNGSGVKWMDGVGVGASPAIVTTIREKSAHGPGQYLDVRCLKEVGKQYEISAQFRLVNKNGASVSCDDSRDDEECLSANMVLLTKANPTDYGMMEETLKDLAMTERPYQNFDGINNRVHGVFTVTQAMADADSVFMYFARTVPNVQIYLDNVSVQEFATPSCDNPETSLLLNGNFDQDATYWSTSSGQVQIIQGTANTGKALLVTNRKGRKSSMTQALSKACLQEGWEYDVRVDFRLFDSSGLPFTCLKSRSCPRIWLWMVRPDGSKERPTISLRAQSASPRDASWQYIPGIFRVTRELLDATELYLAIGGGSSSKIDIAIDNVSVTLRQSPPTTSPTPAPSSCPERDTDTFVDHKGRTRTCGDLSRKTAAKIAKNCNKRKGNARINCPDTCGTCSA